MITIRELILELLEYNFDATVSIQGLYEESENLNFSWVNDDGNDSKRNCKHLFIETDYRYSEDLEKVKD